MTPRATCIRRCLATERRRRGWPHDLFRLTSPPFQTQQSRPASRKAALKPILSAPQHNTLASFLAYADRTGLDRTTTLFVGTHYEYTVASALQRLGFALERKGGSSDKGVDLLGRWRLPDTTRAAPHVDVAAFVSCKALRTRAGPDRVRELEGAFAAVPRPAAAAGTLVAGGQDATYGPERVSHGVVGLLATPLPATKGVREAIGRSRLPMAFVNVTLAGSIQQLLWNRAAGGVGGLAALDVETRFREFKSDDHQHDADGEATGMSGEVLLTWQGQAWEFNT